MFEYKQLSEQLKQVTNELESLQRQSSNISKNMIDLRRRLADTINVSESALPFVGNWCKSRMASERGVEQ